MPDTLSLRSVESRTETPSTQTFLFRLAEDAFRYQPGQYITIKLLDDINDPRGPQRPFTLSSSPTDQNVISITVKMTGSVFKQRLQQLARQGGSLDEHLNLRGPLGSFTLDAQRPAIMIAGGIGITPFRSMLRSLGNEQQHEPIRLLYSNSTPEEIAFREELDELADQHDWLQVIHTISRPEDSDSPWRERTGRIDAELIREVSADLQQPLYYVCGPPGMVKAMTDILQDEFGIAEEDLRVEKFVGY